MVGRYATVMRLGIEKELGREDQLAEEQKLHASGSRFDPWY